MSKRPATTRIPRTARQLTHDEAKLLLWLLKWGDFPRSGFGTGCYAKTPHGQASIRLAKFGLVTRETERTWDRRTYCTIRLTTAGMWLAKSLLMAKEAQ